MKYKLGIYGSSVNIKPELDYKLVELGEVLASYKDDILLVTGACPGVPLRIAKTAYEKGSQVWGFSPATNIEHHKREFPDDDVTIYEKLYYVSPDYKYNHNVRISNEYRNLSSTAFVDAGIVAAGRWGTLNEFTNLVEMNKIAGVYIGTGEVADSIEYLTKMINKTDQGPIIMDSNPHNLVNKILELLKSRIT